MQTNSKKNPKAENLVAWLCDPRADACFGRTFVIRFAVLTAIITGAERLAEVARRHGVTKQSVSRHAAIVRRAYDLPGKQSVDSNPLANET